MIFMLLFCLLLFHQLGSLLGKQLSTQILPPSYHPYNQQLPDCQTDNKNIMKTTKKKGIVCPLVKDEEGFLSEWVAYYEMMGFDHIILYDDNSTTSFAELKPWIDSGFVTIKREWWSSFKMYTDIPYKKRNEFWPMMLLKMIAELDCKQVAVEMGIEIFVSLDLDEYLIPGNDKLTVMDELDKWFQYTGRGFAKLDKLNFSPTPHFLEPINLLTIEAFQVRMGRPGVCIYVCVCVYFCMFVLVSLCVCYAVYLFVYLSVCMLF